jgi:RNA polymerase subunit RPABC4/transcription elongation factor Spt4
MKYCYQCGRLTAGEPIFCTFCGRSYDVKLCPRLHVNPRYAEVCSQCGSRDLSTPQPKVSIWWKVLERFVRVLLAILLTVATVAVLVALATEALSDPRGQAFMVGIGFLLGGLWALWSMLPEWFRKAIHNLLHRKERRHER